MRRLVCLIAALIVGQAGLVPIAGAQPPHCAQILYCLFNQEAAASDPAGIHKYSEDLIGAVVQNPADNESLRKLKSQLADRLAHAEQAARTSNGKLVPEAAVAKAFNDLMGEIGAPASMRTSEASVHGFRQHAASIKAFPALFTADRNGTNCNPGEAVFLLSELISNDGHLSATYLDDEVGIERQAQIANAQHDQDLMNGRMTSELVTYPQGAEAFLSTYYSRHRARAIATLFNHLARSLGM